MNKPKAIAATAFCLILCLPVTGFIYGFISCIDCRKGIGGFLGRIFIGLIGILNTVITLGRPWETEAGTDFTDIRLWVLLTFALLTVGIYLLTTRHKRK